MTVRVPLKDQGPQGLRRTSRTAGIVVASSLLVGATQAHAQDVAEAARQARARKEQAQQKSNHVYTEQDLQRAQILTPQDRAVIAAKRRQLAQPGELPTESLDANLVLTPAPLTPDAAPQVAIAPVSHAQFSDVHVSLGEVARAYRQQKALAAAGKNFHLPYADQPALAAPQPMPLLVAPPAQPSAPQHFELRKPVSAPTAKAPAVHPTLRSPFGRPALVAPAQSELSATPVHPAVPTVAQTHPSHNFVNPRVAPNVPRNAGAAPAAPQLHALSADPVTAMSSVPVTVAKPAPVLHLNAAAAPVRKSHAAVAPVAPKLATTPTAAASLNYAPATVAKPRPVLRFSVTPAPALPTHTVIAPIAPQFPAANASAGTLAPAAPAPLAPSVAATTSAAHHDFMAPAPKVPGVRSKKSAVIAPLLNLVAPRSIAVQPGVIAPPAPQVAHKSSAPQRSALPGQLAMLTVQVGDSLWTLAEKNLGGGAHWHALLAVNPAITNPDHILPGTTLLLPASDSLAHAKPSPTVAKITVKKGDTLWAIAQARFGRGQDWNCIAQSNPTLKNPHRIFAQQEIFLARQLPEIIRWLGPLRLVRFRFWIRGLLQQ